LDKGEGRAYQCLGEGERTATFIYSIKTEGGSFHVERGKVTGGTSLGGKGKVCGRRRP